MMLKKILLGTALIGIAFGSLLPQKTNAIEQNSYLIKGQKSNYVMKLAQNSQVWNITRHNATYQIKIRQRNGNFNGSYNNINNDSIFTGKFLTGRGNNLIHFVQEDDNGYYAIHSGIMINSNLFKGRWYDSTGDSGTFRLYK